MATPAAPQTTRASATPPTEAGACCPRFDPQPWQHRTVVWHGKPFVRATVHSFLHMPLDFGPVMTRLQQQVDADQARDPALLTLADAVSPWHTDLYIAVTHPVHGAENTVISGTFETRVFEGPFRHMRDWMHAMDTAVRATGQVPRRMLAWYTTCPKCAKRYGKNYVVLFAEVAHA